MWLERVSGDTVALIDLEDAKNHLRIISPEGEDPELDAELERAIAAASTFLDVDEDGFGGLGFPLVGQQWSIKMACFVDSVLNLPFARVRSVDAVTFKALNGNTETVPATDYVLVKSGRRYAVELLPRRTRTLVADRPDAVTLTFSAGWSDVSNVPEDIKAAARLLIGHFYENRQAEIEGAVTSEIEIGVERLTRRYQAWSQWVR